MKRQKNTETKKSIKTIATKGGAYSLIVSAVVIAIVIVINIIVATLPTIATKYDISSSKLYSVTSNTKAVVNALTQDVTIYWIVQNGEEDSVIENLLGKYESLSEYLEVVKKNPDVYPTFAAQYTDEDVSNNSLIVESGEKSRYIAYEDIYLTEADMTTYSYTTSFDGEGCITSAIDYVVSEDLPQLYILEGHGEAELSSTFTNQLEKENIETNTISLLNEDEIPEDADCVLIYGPETDISNEEKEILSDYCENGGKLLVLSGLVEEDNLDNLNSLLEDYGLEMAEGVALEDDRDYYAFSAPYVLLPSLQSSTITDPLIEEKYYVIVPLAKGIITDNADDSVTVLLSTSDTAYSKVDGYAITTYEREDGDINGPFALGVSIATGSGEIIWYTSSLMLDDTYNSYSSGANVDIIMNSLSELVGENETLAIRSKSLSYSYLTISDSTAALLKAIMIGIIPAAYIIVGIIIVLNRRRRQNEAV